MHLAVVLWVCPSSLSPWFAGKLEIESSLAYRISSEWLSREARENGRRIGHPSALISLGKYGYSTVLEASQ